MWAVGVNQGSKTVAQWNQNNELNGTKTADFSMG